MNATPLSFNPTLVQFKLPRAGFQPNNHPNPFNPTLVQFKQDLPVAEEVDIDAFNPTLVQFKQGG